MIRAFTPILLAFGAFGLVSCMGGKTVQPSGPRAEPVVRILHSGQEVAHSNFEKSRDPQVTCPNGYLLQGAVYAVNEDFPAQFDVEVMDRWGVSAAEVIVFGGTIVDTDPDVRVRSVVQNFQNSEIARREFSWIADEGIKSLRFGVVPLIGAAGSGPGNLKIMARAFDRSGYDTRTPSTVVGTYNTLCGPA